MGGFQNIVKKENIGVAIKEIDIAPTLCALLGISIPFENFGKLIFDLYKNFLKKLNGEIDIVF